MTEKQYEVGLVMVGFFLLLFDALSNKNNSDDIFPSWHWKRATDNLNRINLLLA